MRYYKLTYTNIFDYRNQRSRIIRARDEEEAKLWFENHLDNENLLDWIDEVEIIERELCG